MSKYQVGDLVRVKGTFTDSDNNNIDPTSVFATINNPDGTTTSLTHGSDSDLIKDTDGVYYTDISLDLEGVYAVRIYSTGTGQASGNTTLTADEEI